MTVITFDVHVTFYPSLHKCVYVVVDGVFSAWSVWGGCNVTCGGGIQWRDRSCENRAHGGKDCDGPRKDSRDCNTISCAG